MVKSDFIRFLLSGAQIRQEIYNSLLRLEGKENVGVVQVLLLSMVFHCSDLQNGPSLNKSKECSSVRVFSFNNLSSPPESRLSLFQSRLSHITLNNTEKNSL